MTSNQSSSPCMLPGAFYKGVDQRCVQHEQSTNLWLDAQARNNLVRELQVIDSRSCKGFCVRGGPLTFAPQNLRTHLPPCPCTTLHVDMGKLQLTGHGVSTMLYPPVRLSGSSPSYCASSWHY